MLTNQEVEDFIISKLPATYWQLCAGLQYPKSGPLIDRKVDAALQRLRKRGRIAFKREGRMTIWDVV